MTLPLEVFVDLTTTTHGQGRAAGAIRVESEFAAALFEAHPDTTRPVSWSSSAERFVELDRAVASRYVSGDDPPRGDIPGRPLTRPDRAAAGRRILLLTGAGWLSNPVFLHGLLRTRAQLDAELHVVVHDLVHLRFPQWVSADEAARFGSALEAMLAAADRVLVYSASTAKDIEWVRKDRRLPIADVGRMALGTALLADDGQPCAPGITALLDRPFVLYVSTIAKRKNHEFLAMVWSRLADELGDRLPRLVLAGRVAPDQESTMERLGRDPTLRDHLVHVSSASDADLRWLYRHCLFTVFPSLYEGWGLPVAESLAHGKVCLCSSASSIPEVAAGLMPLVDPLDVRGWRQGIVDLLDPETRTAAEARLQRHEPVSWHAAAARLWDAVMPPLARAGVRGTALASLEAGDAGAQAVSSESWSPMRDTYGAPVGYRRRLGFLLDDVPAHGSRITLTLASSGQVPVYVENEINGVVIDGCVVPAGQQVSRVLDVPRDVLLRRGVLDLATAVRPPDGSKGSALEVKLVTLAGRPLSAAEEKSAIESRREVWRLGKVLTFTSGSPQLAFLREGWGEPAHWGTWTIATKASLCFRPLPQPREPLVLRLLVRGFVPAAHPALEVDVSVNGQRLTTWRFVYPGDFQFVERHVTIPPELLVDGLVHLQLAMPDVKSPRELAMSQDERALGVGLARACCAAGELPPAGWKGTRRD